MAFKIAQTPSYKTPVKVATPNGKGGFDISEFKAEFKRLTFDELVELKASEKTHKEALLEVLVGYSDLTDEDDQPLDFNEANVKSLLNIPQALAALAEAFWSSIYKAKEKN